MAENVLNGVNEVHDDEAYEPTYAEAFPPLMSDDNSVNFISNSINHWNNNNTVKSNMAVRSSNVTHIFTVPLEERKFKDMSDESFGDKSKAQANIVSDIMTRTGVAIEMGVSKDQSLSVIVTGKADAVIKARRELMQKLQQQGTIHMKIPKEHHRFIIGRNKKQREDIESATGTRIKLPRPDEPSDIIEITGTREGMEKARGMIQDISDEKAKLASVRFSIPKAFHPFILGPNQQTCQDMMSQYGIRINVPPTQVMSDEISITGEKDGVHRAQEEILDIYNKKKATCKTVSVEVKKLQHKYITGIRGANLAEILADTGVWVEVPPLDSPSETITLRGNADKLGPALTAVYSKANSITSQEMLVEGWLHKYLIGPKGVNIKEINQNFPKVHIELRDDDNKVELEGPPEEVQGAFAAIQSKVQDLVSRMAYVELDVDPKYHRHIIGKNGANISRIRKETGVSIRIPPDDSGERKIRIEGSPEGVSKIKLELIELVEKLDNEKSRDILIDWNLHKLIIGSQGSQIREIRDKFNQVQISFPDANSQSDVVTIRGPRNDVDKCFKYMQQKVEELTLNNHKAEVKVFKDSIPVIVGRGGNNIRKIQDDHDVKINMPKSHGDKIIITGKKENVEKARVALEKIQTDQANIKEEIVQIPQKLHQQIIGAKGRQIQSVIEECNGVQIRFPGENSVSDKVMVRGLKADVEKASKLLKDLSSQKIEENYTLEIPCKPAFHGFLIGRNGSAIGKFKDQYNVRISFPAPRDPNPEFISIIGKKEDVEKAKKELEIKIAELENLIEKEMDVDPKFHRHFTVRRGDVVNQLTEECGGVALSFPRPNSGSHKVVLKGPKQCVELAMQRINEIVAELVAQVTVEVEVPHRYHGNIMGQRGFRVQELQRQFKVAIKFPERRNEETKENGDNTDETAASLAADVIMVTGLPEDCVKAEQAIKDLIPITEEVPCPFEYHGQIIGTKGAYVRQLQEDHGVQVSIPHPSEEKQYIRLIGPSKNLAGAKKVLEEKIKQLDEDKQDRDLRSYRLEFIVPAKYHTQIIGRKGANIAGIRERHDVNVRFPEKNSENCDQIIITGYQEKAEAARDEIVNFVEELENKFVKEITIDHRVHPRLIGAKGRTIHGIMEQFKVEIRFGGVDNNSDLVTVSGNEDDVLDCCDHLLDLEEEYIQDIVEREDSRPSQPTMVELVEQQRQQHPPANQKGFIVKDAPWCQPSFNNMAEEFPDLGPARAQNTHGGALNSVWGARK